ncbi:MAG TPA: hypothetical protein VM925_32290 [Labilithrix sp.]|nr:hypothetical protein [Labilithrix sp.]
MNDSRLNTWLASKRLPLFAVLAACVLALPSLPTRLVVDDLWHRAMLHGDMRWIPAARGPLHLFEFASGAPEETARVIESGFAPWWTGPGLRVAFFRPLASLTHALDYALWPSSPALMHAQSIAWYAVVVYLASRLYRRWLDPISPVATGIATLFYAIDHNHGLPVGWIANRNALVATAFALGALLFHDTGSRRARPGIFPFAAASALGLALSAGEGALATLFYLGAHAVFLDERSVRDRARALAPAMVVVVGWVVVYRAGRFGVSGSGIYADPLRSPAAYASSLIAHVPLLLGAELGAPTPDGYPFLPIVGKVAFVLVAAGVVLWAGRVVVRMLRAEDERLRRVSRFLVCASTLSVLPACATFPSGRTLLIAGFGMMALLGIACAGALQNAPWTRSTSEGRALRVVRTYAAWSWLGHLILAPFLFVLNLHSMVILDGMIRGLAEGVPADGSASGKRLVLVNAPDTSFSYYLVVTHIEDGRAPPERMLIMAGNRRDLRVTRTDERTFSVREDGGFYRTATELLFRDVRPPLPAGTRIALTDVEITVTHVMDDGVPDEASFVFTKDLEASYLFRQWQGKALVPFELPRVGETLTYPGRVPDLVR